MSCASGGQRSWQAELCSEAARPTLWLISVFCSAALNARAENNTISDYVTTLNNKLIVAGNLKSGDVNNVNISDTVPWLPQGCKITLNQSQMSAQKACIGNLREGVDAKVQLPHVMLSCPGPDKGLRLRPAYTLCPQGGPSNSVEIGEDNNPPAPVQAPGNGGYTFTLRKLVMADILVPGGAAWQNLRPQDTLDVSGEVTRCARCHNRRLPDAGTKPFGETGVTAQLSFENDPFGVVRKDTSAADVLPFVIYTTEPNKKAEVNPDAFFMAQSLEDVCKGIRDNWDNFVGAKPNLDLCDALVKYQKDNGCGTGQTQDGKNRKCIGVSGGGTYKNDQNEISSLSIDFSGQATNDGTNIVFLDWEGNLTAVNYTKRTSIQALVLTSLTGTRADSGFVLTGNGTAQFTQGGGAPAAKTVTVVLDIGNKTIKITDSDSVVLVDAKTGVVGAALKLNQN